MELTLSSYGEQAILLALFKVTLFITYLYIGHTDRCLFVQRKQDPALHVALKQATIGVNIVTTAGEVPLRDLLVSDTLKRINTPEADADTLQTILGNLETYLDSTHSQPLPVALLLSAYLAKRLLHV